MVPDERGSLAACAICDLLDRSHDPGLSYAAGFAMGFLALRTRPARNVDKLALCFDHHESMTIALHLIGEDAEVFFRLNPHASPGSDA